jgi:hypothetical protein
MPTFNFSEVADTSNSETVDIPSAEDAGVGAEILVKDTSGAAGSEPITVTPESGDIDGAASYSIASDYGFVKLRSDGFGWLVVAQSAPPLNSIVLATGASHTADDIITALQTLGLVTQS